MRVAPRHSIASQMLRRKPEVVQVEVAGMGWRLLGVRAHGAPDGLILGYLGLIVNRLID